MDEKEGSSNSNYFTLLLDEIQDHSIKRPPTTWKARIKLNEFMDLQLLFIMEKSYTRYTTQATIRRLSVF